MLGFKNFIDEASTLLSPWTRKSTPKTNDFSDEDIFEPIEDDDGGVNFNFPSDVERKSREEEEFFAGRERARLAAKRAEEEEQAELIAARKEGRKPRTKAEREAFKINQARRAEAEKYSKAKAWPPPSFAVKQAEPFGSTEDVSSTFDTAFHSDDMKSVTPREKNMVRRMWNNTSGTGLQRINNIALELGMPIEKVKRIIYGAEPQIDPGKNKELQRSRTPNWRKLVDKYGLTPEQAWYYLRKKGRVQSGTKRENVSLYEWIKENLY